MITTLTKTRNTSKILTKIGIYGKRDVLTTTFLEKCLKNYRNRPTGLYIRLLANFSQYCGSCSSRLLGINVFKTLQSLIIWLTDNVCLQMQVTSWQYFVFHAFKARRWAKVMTFHENVEESLNIQWKPPLIRSVCSSLTVCNSRGVLDGKSRLFIRFSLNSRFLSCHRL